MNLPTTRTNFGLAIKGGERLGLALGQLLASLGVAFDDGLAAGAALWVSFQALPYGDHRIGIRLECAPGSTIYQSTGARCPETLRCNETGAALNSCGALFSVWALAAKKRGRSRGSVSSGR